MNKPTSVNKDKTWFSDLLKHTNISTTKYITDNVSNIKFVLLKQKISDLYILREIGFFSGDKIICRAINKVEKNDFVNKWIKENPEEPFGRVFIGRKLDRIPVLVTPDSRKYIVKGDVNAEIEEKFYPLC